MKKLIAKIMATVMLTAAVLQGIPPMEVLANTTASIRVEPFQNILQPGVNSPAPIIIPNSFALAPDQIHLSLDLGTTGNSAHRLSYQFAPVPTDNNGVATGSAPEAILEIERFGNWVRINYEIEGLGAVSNFNIWDDRQGGAFLPLGMYLQGSVTNFPMPGEPPASTRRYRVLNGRPLVPHMNQSAPWNNIPLEITNPVDEDGDPLEDGNGNVLVRPAQYRIIEDQNPRFEIMAEAGILQNGFTFQYHGRTVHIRYDSATGRFHYASDGFMPGIMYEFTLRSGAAISGPSDVVNRNQFDNLDVTDRAMVMLAGADASAVKTIPFANDDIVIEQILPAHLDNDFVRRAIDRRFDGGSDNADNRWPADPNEDIGFILQFPLPRHITRDASTFDITGDLAAAINLEAMGAPQNNVTFVVADLLDAPFISTNLANANFDIDPNDINVNTATGIVTIVITDMEDGVIMNNTVGGIGLTGSGQVVVGSGAGSFSVPLTILQRGSSPIEAPMAHTFLHMTLHPIQNELIIENLYQMPGIYVILQNIFVPSTGEILPNPDPPMVGRRFVPQSGINGSVSFPIIPGADFVYQIAFLPTPVDSGQVLDDTWIRSQYLVISRDPDLVEINFPRVFNAVGTHHPREGYIDGTRGTLDLDLTWDLGNERELSRLFSQVAEETSPGSGVFQMWIEYYIEWSASPEHTTTDDLVGYVPIRITITLEDPQMDGAVIHVDALRNAILSPDPTTIRPTIDYTFIGAGANAEGNIRQGNNAAGQPAPRMEILPRESNLLVMDSLVPGPIDITQLIADFSIRLDTYHLQLGVPAGYFRFPNIYLFRVNPRARLAAGGGIQSLFEVDSSEFRSITISDFDDMQAPPPQNMELSDARAVEATDTTDGNVSFDVSFDISATAIRSFLEQSYGLRDTPGFNAEIEMTLYITQDQAMFTEMLSVRPPSEEGWTFPATAPNPTFMDLIEIDVERSGFIFDSRPSNFEFFRHRENLVRRGAQGLVAVDISDMLMSTQQVADPNDPTQTISVEVRETELFFSDVDDNEGIASPGSGSDLRDELRAGNMVAVRNITMPAQTWAEMIGFGQAINYNMDFTLHGLDADQEYFVIADIIIRQEGTLREGTAPDGTPIPPRGVFVTNASLTTGLTAIRTPGYIVLPDGMNQNPPAPDVTIVTDETTLDTSMLRWVRIPELLQLPEGYQERLEYEVVRIRAGEMTTPQMNFTGALDATFAGGQSFWQSLLTDVNNNTRPTPQGLRAFRTYRSYDEAYWDIHEFTGNAYPNSWTDSPATVVYGEETTPPLPAPNHNLAVIYFSDGTLQANTVYYYYVRTVRIITRPVLNASGEVTGWEEVSRRRSVWNHATVTTTLTEGPDDLILHPGTPEVNLQVEMPISFLAPIDHLDNIGENLFIEYSIRNDEGQWGEPVRMDVAHLLNAENHQRVTNQAVPNRDRTSWYRFFYTVRTGIQAGRYHEVRVRMVQEMEGENGETLFANSPWTGSEIWVADRDTEQDEFDREVGDWLDRIRDEMYALLRRPYWVMQDTNQGFRVIFRPSRFDQIMWEAVGGTIHLPFNQAQQTHYYIPAVIFNQIFENEMNILLTSETMEIQVFHNTIDVQNNQAVISAARALRYNEISDYMIRFAVDWSTTPNVHADPVIGYVADIRLELVASEQNIGLWEDVVLEEILERIDEMATLESYVGFIRDGVEDESVGALEIDREVLRLLEALEQSMTSIVANRFRDLPTRAPLATGFDRAVNVQTRVAEATSAITPYVWANNTWVLSTATFNNGNGVILTNPSAVVFTGRTINIPGLVGSADAGLTRAIVARHGLDDFFGRGNIDVEAPASRGMLIDSVARILGAPRGASSSTWLRGQGINLVPGAPNASVQVQEALQMMMVVYEGRTGTTVESIRISNFGLTANLQGLNPNFAPSFRAAIEIGLYRNYNLTPGTPTTIGELLDILTALERLIGL